MKIILATGIYPPDIGGPATYCKQLAAQLVQSGCDVKVITYARDEAAGMLVPETGQWPVIRIPLSSGPVIRWLRYAWALGSQGADADIVYAFSSVSCGVPLLLSRLKKPKKILRLGGDFLWERYTDQGGEETLREWYGDWFFLFVIGRLLMGKLLRSFNHIVFSTEFQRDIYAKHYRKLPPHSVIENALPPSREDSASRSGPHHPLRVLFMGRFVGFKNLLNLIDAAATVPDVALTIAGAGPMEQEMRLEAQAKNAPVTFVEAAHGAETIRLFDDHDLLILPSLTEISPNIALEARAAGLPVLITEENGLSGALRSRMIVRPLRSLEEIASAIRDIQTHGAAAITGTQSDAVSRDWSIVCQEHLSLFRAMMSVPTSPDSQASLPSSPL